MIQMGEVFKVAGLLLALWMVLFLKWLRPGILGLFGSTGLGVGVGFGLVFLFFYNVRRKKALNDGVRPALGVGETVLEPGFNAKLGGWQLHAVVGSWVLEEARSARLAPAGCNHGAQPNGIMTGDRGQAEGRPAWPAGSQPDDQRLGSEACICPCRCSGL